MCCPCLNGFVSVLSSIPGWVGWRLVECVGCGERGKKGFQAGEQRPPDRREPCREGAGDRGGGRGGEEYLGETPSQPWESWVPYPSRAPDTC